MKNKGKIFEEDFQKSAQKVMTLIRLKDPASSFNIHCQGCDKQRTRFSVKNICDFIGYYYPNMFLFELKSHKGKSMPFKAIKTGEKDKRIDQMTTLSKCNGIYPIFVFNWRDLGNATIAVPASRVLKFMNTSSRKSIPASWTFENGVIIPHRLKKVRYEYDLKRGLYE